MSNSDIKAQLAPGREKLRHEWFKLLAVLVALYAGFKLGFGLIGQTGINWLDETAPTLLGMVSASVCTTLVLHVFTGMGRLQSQVRELKAQIAEQQTTKTK